MVALHKIISPNEPTKLRRRTPTAGRPSKSKRPEWAARVFDHIPAGSNDAPISGEDLAALSGLTLSQVSAAIEHLRDNHPDLPLVSSPRGYLFTLDATTVAAYYGARAKAAYTIMRRLYSGAVEPFLRQSGINSKDAKLIAKQFSRAIEDLADIIA